MTSPERTPEGGMLEPVQPPGEWLGRALVALQFGLLLGLAWHALQSGRLPMAALKPSLLADTLSEFTA